MKPLALGCLGLILAPIVLIIAVGVVSAGLRYTPTTAAAAKSSLAAPTVAGSWSAPGSNLTTEPFAVQGSSARLEYQIDPVKGGEMAQLCVTVKQADGTAVKADCYQQNGTTQLYLKPGRYYLEIRAVSGPWRMTLTDLP